MSLLFLWIRYMVHLAICSFCSFCQKHTGPIYLPFLFYLSKRYRSLYLRFLFFLARRYRSLYLRFLFFLAKRYRSHLFALFVLFGKRIHRHAHCPLLSKWYQADFLGYLFFFVFQCVQSVPAFPLPFLAKRYWGPLFALFVLFVKKVLGHSICAISMYRMYS